MSNSTPEKRCVRCANGDSRTPERLYMDALEAVPLPAKYWAIPGTPNCIPLSENGG